MKSGLLQKLKRVVLVHLGGGVGDLLLSTALAGQLKRNIEDVQVAMMVKQGTEGILEGHPQLDEVIVLAADALKGRSNFNAQRLQLARKHFDAALALWSTASVAWLLYLAGIPVRVGQGSRLLYSFLYTHKVAVRSERGDTTSHWVECLLDYVRAMGCTVEDPQVIIKVDEATRAGTREMLSRKGWDGAGKLVGLHVGKGMALDESRWPVDYFAALADGLAAGLDGTLVLTGDRREQELVAAVLRRMKNRAVNMAGCTTLKELAALTSFCSVFVCPDSAPGHIAAAMGVPTVALFALKSDFPDRWRPFSPFGEVLRPDNLSCERLCIKEKCPRLYCYESISIEKVLDSARRLARAS